ncbi:hypothetical protein DAE56_22975 [Salmonella enterica]|nr:hypothetical protein [Salmonella enterica]
MITHKNRLPVSLLVGYIRPAPHKTGAGIETPLTIRAHNRASGFFTCIASSHLRIMAGRAGQPQGWPGSLVAGSLNPVRLATQSLRPLAGELSQFTTRGYPSWQTANIPALTRTVSIPKLKSAAASVGPIRWHIICRTTCSACLPTICLCGCRQSWIISPTICRTFSDCYTHRKTRSNTPENLTQKQHSACWWGVCLSDIQEAL